MTKYDVIIAEVIDIFSDHFITFPLQCCFTSLAESVSRSPALFFERVRLACRESVFTWSERDIDHFKRSANSTKSMQTNRSAAKVFNILHLTAAKIPITSSTQFSNGNLTKQRSLLYNKNSEAIRELYGMLPAWQKCLPSLVITCMRCAVKVAQKRYHISTCNLIGDDIVEVFAAYALGETTHEFDKLFEKLELHFETMHRFVEWNCHIGEIELNEDANNRQKLFREGLAKSRNLLKFFNNELPIIYAVNDTFNSRIRDSWTSECGEETDWKKSPFTADIKRNAHFTEYSEEQASQVFGDISLLIAASTGKSSLAETCAICELSMIASSHQYCAITAKEGYCKLDGIGYVDDCVNLEDKNSSTKRPSGEPSRGMGEKKVMIRNKTLQMDLFRLWNAIINADRYLDDILLKSTTNTESAVQMFIPEKWYQELFSNVVAPDMVTACIGVPDDNNLLSVCSRVMRHSISPGS